MSDRPATDPAVIDVRDLRYRWPGAGGFTLAVDRFTLAAASSTLLVGPSGTGKSTLLALLAGIAVPASGRVEVLGTDIVRLSASARDAFRAEHIGIVFQMFNLLPYGSVVANVLLPLSFAPVRRARASAERPAEAEALRLLARLGLPDDIARHRSASALSVGQQQRVAAARALVGSPEIVIADEPTSALDGDTRDQFLDLLFAEIRARGAALLMVSHDRTLAPRFDRVLRLDEIARAGTEAT